MNKVCFIIPTFNHGKKLRQLFEILSQYNFLCILIDDGSDQLTKNNIEAVEKDFSFLEVITFEQNCGKGAAVIEGLKVAYKKGFTHALQIDADCQHNLDDISLFLSQCEKEPQALISGQPIYDQSIPKSRLYGRKITNFWVAVETLTLELTEAMCGFRIYPLRSTIKLIEKAHLSKKMAFDIDILVRLYWDKVPVIFIPTKVIYPVDGSSNFKAFSDNLRISLMHTRLFFGMLSRLPSLFFRKFK